MQLLGFLLFYIIAVPLSYLPLGILHIIGDGLYVLVYKVFSYRLKVVRSNLKKSFPSKSEKELKAIEKKYYHNLCEWIIESVKLLTISKKEFLERITFRDQVEFDYVIAQKKHVLLVGGHFYNFEWGALRCGLAGTHDTYGLYTPMTNPYFNKFITKNRGRFGEIMVVAKDIKDLIKKGFPRQSAIGYVADQSPRRESKVYWTTFLNQETAVFTGVERHAIELNAQVVFLYPVRLKRGYYELRMKLISDEPQLAFPFAITESHTRFLESIINDYPDAWMWSHKRWKLKREPLAH